MTNTCSEVPNTSLLQKNGEILFKKNVELMSFHVFVYVLFTF